MANRAWLYCRVGGGHEHDAEEVLETQEKQLLDYCEKEGLQVAGITKALGSGKNDLDKLVCEGLAKGSFDVLVAASASRLSRDIMSLLSAVHKLEEQGIGICLVKEGICTLPVHDPEQEPNTGMGGMAL